MIYTIMGVGLGCGIVGFLVGMSFGKSIENLVWHTAAIGKETSRVRRVYL